MNQAPHHLATIEEVAHTFEQDAAPDTDLSRFAFEDWFTLAAFWAMGLCVFLQFFTRYALNNSLSWTEEVASNCLVVVVFLGAVMCVRLSRHIHVDVMYHYLPHRAARALSILVDLVRIAFFIYATTLVWRYLPIVENERMISLDLPRSALFYTILISFVLMTLRSVQVFIGNLRRGYSVLERPGAFDGIGE